MGDKKSRTNRRTEAEQATRRAETIDRLKRNGRLEEQKQLCQRLERNWREEKQLIDEKSRNNRRTGAEWSSKKLGGKSSNTNKQTRKIHVELDSSLYLDCVK